MLIEREGFDRYEVSIPNKPPSNPEFTINEMNLHSHSHSQSYDSEVDTPVRRKSEEGCDKY